MEYPEGFFSSYHSQKPICGVLAVALAAGVSYDIAHEHCKATMHILYPKRQRFGGRTYSNQRELAMDRLGVKYEKTEFVTKRPKLVDIVKTFEPGVMYHVVTAGHIQTIKDGILVDQGVKEKVENCPQAKKRVKHIIKIIGRGW
jgi:hypothetical protein